MYVDMTYRWDIHPSIPFLIVLLSFCVSYDPAEQIDFITYVLVISL